MSNNKPPNETPRLMLQNALTLRQNARLQNARLQNAQSTKRHWRKTLKLETIIESNLVRW